MMHPSRFETQVSNRCTDLAAAGLPGKTAGATETKLDAHGQLDWGGRDHVGTISPDGREATPLALADASRGVLPLIQTLARGESLPSPSGARLPVEVITLRAPLPRPLRSIFCVGRNYHAHADELAGSVFREAMPRRTRGRSSSPSSPSAWSARSTPCACRRRGLGADRLRVANWPW